MAIVWHLRRGKWEPWRGGSHVLLVSAADGIAGANVCGRLVALGTFALRSPCYQGPPLIDTLSGRVANQ